ncbi:hypothetical protein LguiB_028201 [Lonicera macranthoides]
MDAKDILGLPKTPLSITQEKKSRPQKDSQRKPDGISREVYALTGGLAPLMPSLDVTQLKRRIQSENQKVRVVNGISPTGDYSFAKYNKSIDVIKYTDEEYEKYLTDPMWTREETDQVFQLCKWFDLRFIVIADRFPSSRTVEDLKNRYYSELHLPLMFLGSGHPLVKEPYNVAQETERKRALSMVLSQTKQQERRDVEVLAEAKKISESRVTTKDNEDLSYWKLQGVWQSGIPALTSYRFSNLCITFSFLAALSVNFLQYETAQETEVAVPSSSGPDGAEKAIAPVDNESPSSNVPLSSATAPPIPVAQIASTLASLRMLRVYLRTYALDQMVQAASSSAGLRTIKRVEQTLQELGVNLKPKVPTKAVYAEHLELRKEILTLLNLQKQLQNKEEGSSYRENPYAETQDTPKRPQLRVDQDRTFIPDSLSFGGDRVGKRDQKRKAPGRLSESPSSPATQSNKRPRKLKASDG